MTFPGAAGPVRVTSTQVRVAVAVAVGLALAVPGAAFAVRGARPVSTAVAIRSAQTDVASPLGAPPLAAADGAAGDAILDPSANIGAPASEPRSPGPNAPDSTRAPWLTTKITDALSQQARALRAGDRDGFLAAAGARDTGLRADLARRFAGLRTLQVARWDETVAGNPVHIDDGSWSVPVRIRYCFVLADCTPIPATVPTTWSDTSSGVVLTAFGTVSPSALGPRPWEVSDVRAAVGQRVVVGTSQKYAARLPAMLAAAERAAAIADRYAKWGPKPGRYVVFLAGPDDWGTWYGIKEASWAAGYTIPVADSSSEVVLNAARVDAAELGDVLKHEFTHVVTLYGVHRTHPGTWWLVEGLAEYVRAGGAPAGQYDGLGEGRRYIRSGSWDGDIGLNEPGPSASAAEANGRYAVAYLAVRRIADRFGEAKMLDFFAATVRNGVALDKACASVLGVPWSDVTADSSRYIRRTVGAG